MNTQIKSIFIIAILCVVFAAPAVAQTNTPVRQNIKDQVKTERENIKVRKIELNTQLKAMQEAAKNRIETAREKVKKTIEARQKELKDKINKLGDEKKKQIATRLNEQMPRLNTQWVGHFSSELNRLSEILGKIELRTIKAETNGKDVLAVKAAIQNAKAAIEIARTAVETQTKKVYIPCILGVSTFDNCVFASEKELGSAFKTAKEQLKKDLFGLRDGTMKSAREAVQNALQALKNIPEVNE